MSGSAQQDCVRARPWLGTLVEMAVHGPAAADAVEEAFRAIENVHRLMSYHDPESDVSRINRDAAGRSVEISPLTWQVLKAARGFAETSGGLFDVTIAPTLARLGYLPRHRDFPRVSRGGDWRHIELLQGSRVRLTRPVRIDLGGIAKGFAVDRAIDVLKQCGMTDGRVNAGGDLRVFGSASQTIRVRRPRVPADLWPVVALHDGAAATSADSFSARRVRGQLVTPLIQPVLRAPCPVGRSVTVLAANCMTADALTKVVCADRQASAHVLQSQSARALVLEERPNHLVVAVFDATQGGWRRLQRMVTTPPSARSGRPSSHCRSGHEARI